MVAIDNTSCGPCANVLCSQYGCQRQRDMERTFQHQINKPIFQQKIFIGCICPPTSEQTCQNPACPRKPRVEVKP